MARVVFPFVSHPQKLQFPSLSLSTGRLSSLSFEYFAAARRRVCWLLFKAVTGIWAALGPGSGGRMRVRESDSGCLVPLPPKQETYLCLYLPLISSVLSPLNKVICTRVRASPDSVIGSPPLEPVVSYCKEPSTYIRPFTLLGFVLPSAEMKISLLHALAWPSLPRMVRKLLRRCHQLLLSFFFLKQTSPT